MLKLLDSLGLVVQSATLQEQLAEKGKDEDEKGNGGSGCECVPRGRQSSDVACQTKEEDRVLCNCYLLCRRAKGCDGRLAKGTVNANMVLNVGGCCGGQRKCGVLCSTKGGVANGTEIVPSLLHASSAMHFCTSRL